MRQLKITKSITNRESQSLDKYLQEIGREELITAEREVELAQKIKQGDQIALEKLTKANLRFVVSVAKQYQNQGLTLPDLINEGNLGLIKAAQRFDETRGFKFISYAVWWIRQSILQALAEQSRIRSNDIRRGRISDEQFDKFLETSKDISELPLYIDETPEISIADISNKQKPKNSIPIFNATNSEYNIAVITPAHSKILLFIIFIHSPILTFFYHKFSFYFLLFYFLTLVNLIILLLDFSFLIFFVFFLS